MEQFYDIEIHLTEGRFVHLQGVPKAVADDCLRGIQIAIDKRSSWTVSIVAKDVMMLIHGRHVIDVGIKQAKPGTGEKA